MCMCVRQDKNLMGVACNMLSLTAYMAPDLVLPLVHQRFEVRTRSFKTSHCLFFRTHNTLKSLFAVCHARRA